MDWNVFFPFDTFYLVKTWKHDNSVVYRFATASGELASTAGNLFHADCRANTIFLKIQTASYSEAYDLLAKENIKLPREARDNGLSNTVFNMLKQQLTPMNGFLGQKIIQLCKRYSENIQRSKMEQGSIRIFTIVWAPDGESPRTTDMRAFIEKNYETQIWLSKMDATLKAPVRVVLHKFMLGKQQSNDVDTGFYGGDNDTHQGHQGHTHPGEMHPVRR